MTKDFMVFVYNPGSTSDQVSIFKGEEEIFGKTFRYSVSDLAPFDNMNVTAQFEFRRNLIKQSLKEENIDLSQLDAVIGRGGLLHPVPGGVFRVNQDMLDDLTDARYGDHPCNLGAIMAHAIGKAFNKPAYIADSVVVDEMWQLSRYSGLPEIPRKSIFHCLNQKRVARLASKKLNKEYNECNLIVMHAGGGITVGAHVQGKIVDVNNGLVGDGPFTPQRAGGLPADGLLKLAYSGMAHEDIKHKLSRQGGLRAYLGTSDIRVINKFIKGEELPPQHNLRVDELTPEKAKEVLSAMIYQVAKEIGGLATAMKGKVDAIVLSGGVMYDDEFCVPWLIERIQWIAPIFIFPGGDELRALRDAVELVLLGKESPREYQKWEV